MRKEVIKELCLLFVDIFHLSAVVVGMVYLFTR